MKLNEPAYRLVKTGTREWRFEESEEMREVTLRFNDLIEQKGNGPKFTTALRNFLKDHPNHIDALHHYATCKFDELKPLDAYAFAHAAVGVGRSAFPKEFEPGRDSLPGGWVENRPFLRALHGLMLTQDEVGDRIAAIATARELIALDSQDRMGARLVLPEYLLREGRNQEALSVFSMPGFEDTFHTAEYLRALALLRLGRDGDARETLVSCLSNHPQVARFILEPITAPPEDEGSGFGIVSGSPFEGWYYATRYRWLWEAPRGAKELLREMSVPIAAAGWPRWYQRKA